MTDRAPDAVDLMLDENFEAAVVFISPDSLDSLMGTNPANRRAGGASARHARAQLSATTRQRPHGTYMPAFYFTNDLDDVSVKWRYYTTSHAREELLRQTHYTEPEERPAAPAGSLLVTYHLTNRLKTLQAAGWRIEKLISDVDNRPATVILRKLG
jgi:hypothetical protein